MGGGCPQAEMVDVAFVSLSLTLFVGIFDPLVERMDCGYGGGYFGAI